MDGAADIEDDGLGSLLLETPTQRLVAAVLEVLHVEHFAAAAAADIASEALSAGEGGCLLLSLGSKCQKQGEEGKESFHLFQLE